MKKFLLVLVLAALAAGAFYYHRHGKARAEQVASWLPAGTFVFEDMPDLHRTEKRWPATALAQILNEPQVQAFLDKPRTTMPGHDELDRRVAQLQKIDITQFFAAAVTSGTGGTSRPKIVLGLSYAGSKDDLDALVGELRKGVQKTWPAGKSDIVPYGDGEIETFSLNGHSQGLAHRGHWLFLASNVDLLKAILDGYDGKATGPALADADDFKKCLEQIPGDPDNLLFVEPKAMAGSFSSAMMMLQPEADTHQMDYMRKMGAYVMATKLDGALMRESIFLLQVPTTGAYVNSGLNLATANTVVLAEGTSQNGNAGLGQIQSQMAPFMPMVQSYLKPFQDQGLTMEQLTQAFGPGSAFLLDWPPNTPIPTPLAEVAVGDAAKAHKFLDTLAAYPPELGVHFTRQDIDGTSYYSMAPQNLGFFPLQFTMGLTDKSLLGGLSLRVVQDAVKRSQGASGLAGTDSYKQAMALVQAPTLGDAYVDTKTVFERIYNLVRGVASMGMIPHTGNYVDLSKLPETETISKHLTPLVLSNAAKGGGILAESAGPVSFTQAGAVAGIGAAAAMVPYLQSMGQFGAPGFPAPHRMPPAAPAPLATPSAPPAAPIPAVSPSASPSGTTL